MNKSYKFHFLLEVDLFIEVDLYELLITGKLGLKS